ncbi:MAG: hypothetical protein AVDCRST_MAG38-2706, partial [uncultured Solirubrobacteraceae bacterium]
GRWARPPSARPRRRWRSRRSASAPCRRCPSPGPRTRRGGPSGLLLRILRRRCDRRFRPRHEPEVIASARRATRSAPPSSSSGM